MVILITGASHTGKTLLAQKLLEKHQYSCLSIDHLKMGLIRSGNTDLTPLSDDGDLTPESVKQDNAFYLTSATEHQLNTILIDEEYKIEI